MQGTAIAFGGNDLQTFDGSHGIIVQNITHAGATAKRAQTYALSHANASAIPFVEYPNKPITITGQIVGNSIVDCDAQIDIFNSYMVSQNGRLDIGYNGGTRRYIATATNIDVQRPGGLSWANFTVTFTCTQAFGQDINQTNIFNQISNGSFETNLSGWSAFNSATISQSTTQAYVGTHSLKVITTSGANRGAMLTFVNVAPNTTYTLTAYVFVPNGQQITYEIDEYTSSNFFLGPVVINTSTGTGAWQQITLTLTTKQQTAQIQWFIYLNASVTFYIDAVLLEFGANITPFLDGNARTAATYTDVVVFGGTAPFQLPVFTFTYTALTGGTNKTVTIGNNSTAQSISVTRTWSNGDILIVDSSQNIVTVNGTNVDFAGAFPTFAPGTQTIGYSDGLTTRTFNESPLYNILYL